MANYDKAHFYADWPEDIAWLLRYMCIPEGKRIPGQYTFHLIYSGELDSKIPHNALHDAFALQKWHLAEIANTGYVWI